MASITIALDGPGSAGKGTIARGVARALGYAYVDTGAMYRAVALVARQRGLRWADADAVAKLTSELDFRFTWDDGVLRIWADGTDVTRAIRADEISTGASTVSKYPGVRSALLQRQRDLGAEGGVVMDGRDIGTVVLPDAQLKVYLDADATERARRRHEELVRRGDGIPFEQVLSSLKQRDRQDMERDVAPLRRAEDAVLIDSTDLTIPQAIDRVLRLARERGA